MFIPASPVLHLSNLIRNSTNEFERWLPEGYKVFLSSGRSAIYQALKAFGIPQGSTALLPSYLCASVIDPFLVYGCRIEFYRISTELSPDIYEIEKRLVRGDVKVLLVIHYFGFPAQNFSEILELCKNYSVKVIEDCAHALFSKTNGLLLGSLGDAGIFSLRKTLPVPEGGIFVLNNRQGQVVDLNVQGWLHRDGVKLLREIFYSFEYQIGFSLRTYLLSFDCLKNKAHEIDRLALGRFDKRIGKLSRCILRSFDVESILTKRRQNYNYLLSKLTLLRKIGTPLFDELPEGVCPNSFPILVERRDEIRRRLYRNGIALRAFWDVLPGQLPLDRFHEAKFLRDNILVLPVHQEISEKGLDIVLRALFA